MKTLDIRPATEKEFSIAVDWAAAEGWNPGLDDLNSFYLTDPEGFLMGFLDDDPVSSISVVRYGKSYGFLGFYIVRPEFRGQQIGIATWNTGMQYLAGRTIGLDGVIDQVDNYRKSGFVLHGRNIRHTGVPSPRSSAKPEFETRDITADDLGALIHYDSLLFSLPREAFLTEWLKTGVAGAKSVKLALRNGKIYGFGVVRECLEGYKIGPLFSENEAIAEALLTTLYYTLPSGSEISLDTPEDNPSAVKLAQKFNLKPSFETARMYKGEAPILPLNKIYGITTFELG